MSAGVLAIDQAGRTPRDGHSHLDGDHPALAPRKSMTNHRLFVALGLLCLVLITVGWAGAAWGQEVDTETVTRPVVRLGVLANRGKPICMAEWRPTAEYLSAALSPRQFKIVPLAFDEVGGAVEQGRLEFLLVNSSMYVALEARGEAYRIATFQQPPLRAEAPLPSFGGVIFCRADRGDITTLRDLVGKRFGAVERSSFGGWQAAWREFDHLGIRPETDFASLVFAGTHDAVVEAVRNGSLDAGTVRSTQLERMAHEGIIRLDDFKCLAGMTAVPADYPYWLSTRLYPEWPFAALRGTDIELGKAVASALLRMNADDPAAKAASGAGWAIPQDYVAVHECLRSLRLPPYENEGKVTPRQAFVQYRPVILSALAVLSAITTLAMLLWRNSMRLHCSNEALRASEQKYRSVVENIQDVFYRVDRDGKAVLMSPSATRLLGCDSVETLIGQRLDRFWADPAQRRLMLATLERNGRVHNWEFTARRQDGSLLPVAASLHLLRDAHGHAVGYEGIWRDISQRKQAEIALRESERRLAQIIAFLPDATFAIDTQGRVTAWNRAMELLCGVAAGSMLGKGDYAYAVPFYGGPRPVLIDLAMHPNQEIACGYAAFHQEQGRLISETFLPDFRGRGPTWLWNTATILCDADGGVMGAIESIRDITALKREQESRLELERRLLHAQKLESLGVLAGGIAHDFNNLLAAILGNLELALEEIEPLGRARSYIDEAARAVRSATGLTRQMLAYSGKGHFVIQPLDLSALVSENYHMLRAALAKSVSLELRLDEALPPVQADAGQMQQIVMNLITNAAESFGNGGGTVSISTGHGYCDADYLNRSRLPEKPVAGFHAWIEVSDTGCGMDEATQHRLFDPFFTTKFTGHVGGAGDRQRSSRGHPGGQRRRSGNHDPGVAAGCAGLSATVAATRSAGRPDAGAGHARPPQCPGTGGRRRGVGAHAVRPDGAAAWISDHDGRRWRGGRDAVPLPGGDDRLRPA
jgi:PAS domain S-box-containing protein